MTIEGEIVRLCRKKRRITMRELEQLSGVTAKQISNIERGKNNPTIGTYLKLLSAMEFDIEIVDLQEEAAE